MTPHALLVRTDRRIKQVFICPTNSFRLGRELGVLQVSEYLRTDTDEPSKYMREEPLDKNVNVIPF